MLMAGASVAGAAEVSLGKPHVFLIFEDSGGLSNELATVEGPVLAMTDKGRSLQMVVDVIVDGEPDALFFDPPRVEVTARGDRGDVLFQKTWPIGSIGDYGTTMRSFIVDHDCRPVTVEARLTAGGADAGRWEKRVAISCEAP